MNKNWRYEFKRVEEMLQSLKRNIYLDIRSRFARRENGYLDVMDEFFTEKELYEFSEALDKKYYERVNMGKYWVTVKISEPEYDDKDEGNELQEIIVQQDGDEWKILDHSFPAAVPKDEGILPGATIPEDRDEKEIYADLENQKIHPGPPTREELFSEAILSKTSTIYDLVHRLPVRASEDNTDSKEKEEARYQIMKRIKPLS
jgi:hypothetical protein